MLQTQIRKAVIPAAGLGTRFLPATKASPKEMLPLVDKPLIQYAVEEAVASGIEDIMIVTGRGKRAIEDHFDRSFELEASLKTNGRGRLLKEIRRISDLANFCYVRQPEPRGLGHAVLCAHHLIGNEPFAVILGDEIIDARVPGLAQLTKVYQPGTGAILGVQKVRRSEVHRYGIIAPRRVAQHLYEVTDVVEKPTPGKAPSLYAMIGRYIFTPDIFSILRRLPAGRGGEIQLTDAIRLLGRKSPLLAKEIQGVRYDAGDKLGFLKATVHFALKSPTLGPEFSRHLRQIRRLAVARDA